MISLRLASGILVLMSHGVAQAADDHSPNAHREALARACIDAHFETQRLRQGGQLLSARRAAEACLEDECPSLLREECGKWRSELTDEIPRVVASVTDEAGVDVLGYSLFIDGVEAPRANGAPLELDPGVHEFVARSDGFEETKAELELRSGERLRKVVLTMRRSPVAANPVEVGGPERVLWPGYVLAGTSLALLGGASVVGAMTRDDEARYRRTCAPDCAAEVADDLALRYTLVNVGFGLAAASALGSLAWFVWAPTRDGGAAVVVAPRLDGGVTFGWARSF